MPTKLSGGQIVPVPPSAGTGEPAVNTQPIEKNIAIDSSGDKSMGVAGPFANLGAEILNINGYDILKFKLAPSAGVTTNQEVVSYMDGGLSTNATVGSSGFFGAILRGIAGASVLQNVITNPTNNSLKIVISPLLQGSVLQIDIKAGETWRFADKSFLACTPNLNISGNINIFSNFRMMFVGENLTYTTVSASNGPGTVWISSYGAVERHEIEMGTGSTVPLFINNGCFLGMLDNNGSIDFWNSYVTVGTSNGFFNAMFTQLGWMMKIQDTVPPRIAGSVKCVVYTQSLNPHNLEKFIANIAQKVVDKNRTSQGQSFLTTGAGVGPSANPAILGTAALATGAVAAAVPGIGATNFGQPAGNVAPGAEPDAIVEPVIEEAPVVEEAPVIEEAPVVEEAPAQNQEQRGGRRRRRMTHKHAKGRRSNTRRS